MPWLADYHEAGLLTLASQPAGPEVAGADGRPERRRAFVQAFARPDAAHRAAALAPELLVFRFPARQGGDGAGAVVAERGGEPFLRAGAPAGPEELELFSDALDPDCLAELAQMEYLAVVDPVWGRADVLWPALSRALLRPPE